MPRDQLIDRDRLLAEFDMMTEESVAALLDIDTKTLKNRPLDQQPTFTKIGNKRLYHKASVVKYLAANTVTNASLLTKPLRRRKPLVDAQGAKAGRPIKRNLGHGKRRPPNPKRGKAAVNATPSP
jgi:hypothetical protein